MLQRVSERTAGRAIPATPEPESETSNTLASGNEWFYEAATEILGGEAGLQLHYITGYPASSCYAYVAHDSAKRRRPPEHFFRTLFSKDQGEPFFNAFMASCKARWWSEREYATAVGQQVLAIIEK